MSIKTHKINLKLDPTFVPAITYHKSFQKEVLATSNYEKVVIVVKRNNDLSEKYETVVFNEAENRFDDNIFYLERLVKTLLWIYGGYEITFVGPVELYEKLAEIFSDKGSRSFDSKFMERIYEEEFKVIHAKEVPLVKSGDQAIGKHLEGRRIGFDAGGSDMKVSAVIDGEPIHSEEIVWLPKLNSDPLYHKAQIRAAIQKAVDKLDGKVDGMGVSSAGVYMNNEARVASLFIQVPDDLFKKHIKNIYIDIAKELNIPLEVANDGDVTALAGSMSLGYVELLGIAMGTSEAVGYINKDGHIAGWLNELAFAPVDFQLDGPVDEWSGDIGVGCKYFSQDAVIRLAEAAGIVFDEKLTLAERLKQVQALPEDDETFREIFKTIGTYLAYGLAYYAEFYDIKHVLLLGRVMSGEGGQIIVQVAEKVLEEQFFDLGISLHLPNEKFRRVGQSIAAASLVNIK